MKKINSVEDSFLESSSPSSPEERSKPRILTVTEFNRAAQQMLEGNFSNVWIEGEVSNFRGASSSGHCYFSLKDESAQVDIVAFRGVMSVLRFKLADGLKILICGRASLYPARGRFQIVASLIEPKGAGALQLAFEQLKKKLEAEGLFDPARKRPIPALPQKIGIVTSPTGAAIRDILTVINRRFANVEIMIYPCKVQGEGSKEEIAAGIRYLNQNYPDFDVLLVGRGGGSVEDLWAFNEEIVARAIASSNIPVISCVGHEIDFTIADFVADLRAPTPSAAAEIVVKNKAELLSALAGLGTRLYKNVSGAIQFFGEQLRGLMRSSVFARPQNLFESSAQNLDDLFENLERALAAKLESNSNQLGLYGSKLLLLSPQNLLQEKIKLLKPCSERMENALRQKMRTLTDHLKGSAAQLEALSPLAVLSRGYAIAWALPSNKILKSASQVKPRDKIRVRLHEGELEALVQKTEVEHD